MSGPKDHPEGSRLAAHDELAAALRPREDLPRRRASRQQVDIEGVDPALTPWADRARADLATRLQIEPEDIEVAVLGSVTWSDAACGCPDPEVSHIQVPVDGAYAALVVDGVTYHYHGGGRRGPFLCAG